MKTIKVIDLLNKIANGEELPRKIQVYNNRYRLLDNRTYHSIYHEGSLGQNYSLDGMLNDEVEIIEDTLKEDKKIEYIETNYDFVFDEQVQQDSLRVIASKINEIIDELEKLKSKPAIININNTPTMQGPYKITCSTSGKESDK